MQTDTLHLIRIQNDLNSLGLAMRDMVVNQDGYGLHAWRGQFRRLRTDLETAQPSELRRPSKALLDQLWRSADQVFDLAEAGHNDSARRMVIDSLQAQQASLSKVVSRLLVENNKSEETAGQAISRIYDKVERNIYVFLITMLAGVTAIGLGAAHYNRRLFDRVVALSDQRSTLSRRLIGVQEEVFRSVSRELHDDFGQILTAVGLMLKRVEKNHIPADSPLREDIAEVRQVVQETLEKTRSFSQELHPAILDDYGLDRAVERYVLTWEKRTGIPTVLHREGSGRLAESRAIHIYRILQESLNNVARHARASAVEVRLTFEQDRLRLEIADNGVGLTSEPRHGLGLIAMRERTELLAGHLRILRRPTGGTLVTLEVPVTE